MASTATLNARNLEALGAPRLAGLLMELGADNAVVKRRLRMVLAGNAGSADAARAVAKRLATIARSTSRVEWHRIKPLAAELDMQRRAIGDLVAPADPQQALALVWRLIGCAGPVLDRCNDKNGVLAAVFEQAIEDLGPIAQAAAPDPVGFASQVFVALSQDMHGVCAELVPKLAIRLGPAGLDRLRAELLSWQDAPEPPPSQAERRVIGWSAAGPLYADEMQEGHRRNVAASALLQVADALGDVDGFVAQHDARSRRTPSVATAIARRLRAAGRLDEAWAAIEAVPQAMRDAGAPDWEHERAEMLVALGRAEEAQSFRWHCFLFTLDPTHLRAHLSGLGASEGFDREEEALDLASSFPDIHRALSFLLDWPDLHRAARLVVERRDELDGDRYALLDPAAETLASRHPLAATLLHRAMIDFILGNVRSSRYRHAVRHLGECADLAQRVADYAGAADHHAYLQRLQAGRRRNASFWQMVEQECGS